MAAGTRNQQGQLKQQISDLILNDDSIVKLIADVVSSLIVKKLSNSEDTIKKVASSITKEPALVETIAGAVTDKIADDRNDKREELVWELDGLEQYSRRNCLLVHGVAEPQAGTRSRENTDDVVLDVFNNKLGLNLDGTDLDRSHRIGRRSPQSGSSEPNKPRPVIVKFVSYNVRAEVFRSKRKLKGTGLGVSESLTKRRMELYKQVSKHQNTDTAWTLDGRIIALRKVDQRKVVIDSPSDLYKLSN